MNKPLEFWQSDDWQQLITIDDELVIARGAIMRLRAAWPFEPVVDFMYADIPSQIDGVIGGGLIMCVTGHKAGLRELQMPHEAVNSNPHGIRAEWLKENWEDWVYQASDVRDVFVRENYAAPTGLPEP